MQRRTALRRVAFAVTVVVVAAGCSRGQALGPEEAVEILVLDGVGRPEAECVVADLEEELELDKITGLDTDLDDVELGMLSSVSAACAPPIPDGGGIAGGGGVEEDPLGPGIEVDVEEIVAGLMRGGVVVEAAACIGGSIAASTNPREDSEDERFLAEALRVCERDGLSARER